MKKLVNTYTSNFKGLSKEIWLLSFVTFINRAGAMVLPFLSLYLVNDQGYTLPEVGIIMTCYGVGSFLGTLSGGRLTDTIGFYKVIVASLFLGGIGFILFQFISGYLMTAIGMFLLIFIADSYRPAVFVAIDVYSKPENKTRSIALLRLAINLGFSIGPLLGGLIIAHINYSSLFWIDGLTCMIAGIGLFILLKPKAVSKDTVKAPDIVEGRSPYRNPYYLLLFVIMVLSSITFVQYFSVMPLYWEADYLLTPDLIGWLMFTNGAIIVVFEMPLVAWLEKINISKTMAVFWGGAFLGVSFLVVNLTSGIWILVAGMVLMTIGEMIASPFASALALEMAPNGRKGSYMALFSMSFSISHMVGHNGGMNLANTYGFDTTWYIMFAFMIFVSGLTLWLYYVLKKSTKFDTH
ncbi:MFS transporter [Patiriisocius sp. Uisw_047]|jgi:predicted MFS family arabinose efflux permease|uniref:MFS transporter n=1 Tax=Patiriisocius sp. Uisw_047 TaxID=3230969 RepID=UPI0039EAAA74